MYNTNVNYKRKNVFNIEDEAPEKKLISDADIFIKKLSEKQTSRKITLKDQLSHKKEFYKATVFVSVTNYTSGPSSLQNFNQITEYSNEIEKLKSCGLCDDDINLYLSNKQGKPHLKDEYRNVNNTVLDDRLEKVLKIIENAQQTQVKNEVEENEERWKNKIVLATKPQSTETRLLKFALDNEQRQNKPKLPHPMDEINEIEANFMDNITKLDVKKIRKKARSLQNQIDSISEMPIKEPSSKGRKPRIFEDSKWDERVAEVPKKLVRQKKIYSCKPQNLYTIKEGEIVKLNDNLISSEKSIVTHKISLDEIKKMPKFKNYEPGKASNVLYVKNLAKGVTEENLSQVLKNYSNNIGSIKIMTGKMRGQAFVECTTDEFAQEILENCNGTVIQNKPIIIHFSKGKDKTAKNK